MRTTAMLIAALALAPCLALGQSADQVRAYQKFEGAKASNRTAEALASGKEAIRLTEAGGDNAVLIELLLSVADYAAQAGDDEQAATYYVRALKLQETALGSDHPDLVPALAALADLYTKDKRYSDAEVLMKRIVDIERAAYGERHENVLASLGKLRNLYQITNNADAIARVDAQIQAPAAVDRGSLPRPGEIAGKNRRYAQNSQGFAPICSTATLTSPSRESTRKRNSRLSPAGSNIHSRQTKRPCAPSTCCSTR